MTDTIDRRTFLRGSAAAVGAVGASSVLRALTARAVAAQEAERGRDGLVAPHNGSYGPLQDDPAGVLALPAGFSYVRFGETGQPMSDGNPTPADHDGMAAYPGPDGRVLLVRNHELSPNETPTVPGQPRYDTRAAGGTTNLLYDPAKKQLEASYASIAGTTRNCAGGPTPWGSWLTCEETFDSGPEKLHGYIFEVPSSATAPVDPVPLVDMGRFVHEAVAVDPRTGIVYETEDRGTAGFYRFLPNRHGELAQGGKLQMLAIRDRPAYDTRTGQRVGRPLPVTWVDIPNPNPVDTGNALAVYEQGLAAGGATFARLEGAWYGDGSVFIVSTSGGDAGEGQVWEYRQRGHWDGRLTLVFESPSAELLNAPDNITVSPRGGLVLCEDGAGTDYLRGVTRHGQIFDFARNDLNEDEFAGATFSPDGSILFVNIQDPGITFAITGPFEQGAL